MTHRHGVDAAGAALIAGEDKKLPPQVLVVDDSYEVREFVSLLLRLRGYRVIVAPDSVAARKVLESEHPALVISDLEMPAGSGWDMLVYCHVCHPGMPVLIISGTALGGRPEIECLAAGFVAKPFDLKHFNHEVERLLCRAA